MHLSSNTPKVHLFLLLLCFLALETFACDCDEPSITEKYSESDFVAKIKILKVYENRRDEQGYRADIRIDKLYKGDSIAFMYVDGRTDEALFWTSCDIFIPENTELIAYAYQNEDGHYMVGMCSGLLYLQENNRNAEALELEILEVLKNNYLDFKITKRYAEQGRLDEALAKYQGIQLDKHFSIFELILAPDLTTKSVKTISGFNAEIDAALKSMLKESEWTSFSSEQDLVPDNSKLLVGIYYYEAERGNESFLSLHYLLPSPPPRK